jgi:hypothetical protein
MTSGGAVRFTTGKTKVIKLRFTRLPVEIRYIFTLNPQENKEGGLKLFWTKYVPYAYT